MSWRKDDPEELRLQQMLLEVEGAVDPGALDAAVRRIESRYRGQRAILVGDLEGFSRRVQAHGIVPFIATIYRMRRICAPIVEASAGYLFKAEADNLFAAFTDTAEAFRCAVAMLRALYADNQLRGANDRIDLGIGIAAGEVLAIGEADVWGHAINVASKLGEDVSSGGEILLEASIAPTAGLDRYPASAFVVHHEKCTMSGVDIPYLRVRVMP